MRCHAAAAPLAVLLMLVALVAGCAAPPPAPAQEPADGAEPTGPALVSTQEASNLSSAQEADQSEFAKSLDEKFHTHNYWGTSLEKVLMDANVESAPMAAVDTSSPLDFFRNGFALQLGNGGTQFDLPEGSIVPPETTHLDVQVTWSPSQTISGLRLMYSTAANRSVTSLDPFPDGGGAASIATSVVENDMPHTTVSKWHFWLRPVGHEPTLLPVFNGTAHVTITAFRNDTLYVAPPHPDFWGNATTLELLNTSGHFKGQRVLFPVPTSFLTDGEDDFGFAFVEMPNNTIVPPHTGLLKVTLAYQNNATAPNPFDMRPDLGYFSAARGEGRGFGGNTPDGAEAGDGQTIYTINVDARMWDSPYQNESQWGFLLFMQSDTPTHSLLPFGDIGFFEGSYTLQVVAEREQV
jgi:hypothetical protein